MTDIIVPLEESASYVEDMWPDEAAYIAKEAAAKERERIRAAVEALDVDGVASRYWRSDYVLAAIEGALK